MTRQEAIKHLEEWKECISSAYRRQVIDMAIEALSEQKTGHWIFNPKDAIESMFTLPKCSECGFESSDGGNFCPNCGARMLGEDGEE